MKVAIWGSYNYGNYGDDVMGVMFALTLKKLNVEPVIYRMNVDLANKYDITTVFTLNELLEDSTFAFVGGGSWLEKRDFGDSYEKDFLEFRKAIEKYKINCYAISIGGDLRDDPFLITKHRLAFFQSSYFKEASVRLKVDIELIKKLEKQGRYIPDIVLSLPRVFPVKSSSDSRKIKIGLNLHVSQSKLPKLINKFISKLYPNVIFYFITTHLPTFENNYEYQIPKEKKNVKNFHYTSIESFTNFVSDLDLMISFKLHPGVTALAYDVPFYLLGGYEKTIAFFESINANSAIVSENKIISQLLRNKIRNIHKIFNFELIKKHQEESQGHFSFIKELIEKYSKDDKELAD